MPDDDLTLAEKSIILILMATSTELSNVDLTTRHHVKVPISRRERLVRIGLVTTRTQSRRLYWNLTDLGWKRGFAELGADVPPRAGGPGAALYAMLGTLRRYLDHADVPYQDFFQPPAPSTVGAMEIETRIRAAYAALARKPGEWVKLADLRQQLRGLPRQDVDAVLTAMNRTPSVRVVPESNRKTLTSRDHGAAVIIGEQDKHLIAIGS